MADRKSMDTIKKMSKSDRLLWGALFCLMIVCITNYCYVDLQMIVRHSLNLWDSLFSGDILHFYQSSSSRAIGAMNPQTGEVPYDIWLYIPIAIWNLPTYIWEKMTGLTFETNYLALVWARLAAVLPLIGSNLVIWNMGMNAGKKQEDVLQACFIFSSSLFLLNGLFCLGQIDIFNTFFMLMGIYAYMREDRKKFLLWFALAITCKMFALFVFVPLLVYREKRILYMVRDMAAGLSLSLLSKCIFFVDKMATPTKFDERRFLRLLFEWKIELGGTAVALSILLFVLLLIWCWQTEYVKEKVGEAAVWIAFAGYGCFFVGAVTLPYWAVAFSPLPALLILMSRQRAKVLLWLEMAGGAVYFIMGLCRFGYAYAASANVRWMLAGILSDRSIKGIDFSQVYESLSSGAQENVSALLMAVYMGTMFSIFWISRPGKNRSEIKETDVIDKGSCWIRFLMNAGLALLPLAAYFL